MEMRLRMVLGSGWIALFCLLLSGCGLSVEIGPRARPETPPDEPAVEEQEPLPPEIVDEEPEKPEEEFYPDPEEEPEADPNKTVPPPILLPGVPEETEIQEDY